MTRVGWLRTALLAASVLVLVTMPAGSQAAPTVSPAPAGPGSPVRADAFRSVRTFTQVAVPARLRIPAARVDTPLQRLRRASDGTISVPGSPDVAGWYEEGPRPGEAGPSVMLGHVDSAVGPGVFFHLAELSPGAAIYVDREDGSTVTFRMTRVSRVPKSGFPTDLVYSPTLESSLQLVTCGGTFDHRARKYRDNVIVSAVPV